MGAKFIAALITLTLFTVNVPLKSKGVNDSQNQRTRPSVQNYPFVFLTVVLPTGRTVSKVTERFRLCSIKTLTLKEMFMCMCVHAQVSWSLHSTTFLIEVRAYKMCLCWADCYSSSSPEPRLAQFPRTKDSFRGECFLDSHTTICPSLVWPLKTKPCASYVLLLDWDGKACAALSRAYLMSLSLRSEKHYSEPTLQ